MLLFKNSRKTPRPTIRVSMHDSGGLEGGFLPSVLDESDERPRKLRKQSRRASLPSQLPLNPHPTARAHDTSELTRSLMDSANSQSEGGRLLTLGIAEAVLDPNYYTTLLLQASDARYTSQSNPSTPPPSLSRSTRSDRLTNHINDESLLVPPPTPSKQGSMRIKGAQTLRSASDGKEIALNRRTSRMLDPILEGVTYDAILTSTLKKTLAPKVEEDSYDPPTKAPPNTPAPIIQEGGFASLMSLSLAIMEGKMHDSPGTTAF